MKKIATLLMSGAFATGVFAQAADTVNVANITAAKAMAIAQAAAANCEGRGFPVTAAVTDANGDVKAIFRSDGIGSSSLASATQKAFTSASAKSKTSDLASRDSSGHLGDIPGFLLLAGGVPITSGEATIGAVGVGGAPGGDIDEACAQAGIDSAVTPTPAALLR